MVPRATRSAETPADPLAGQQLASFLAKYNPEVQTLAVACLHRMRELVPDAFQLVYDNYNALAIGFGFSERTSEALFSIALFPRWVSLFFLKGKGLPDPDNILRGSGNVVRHIVLKDAADLDKPAVRKLIDLTLAAGGTSMPADTPGKLVIKSVSAKQRPRRPASAV